MRSKVRCWSGDRCPNGAQAVPPNGRVYAMSVAARGAAALLLWACAVTHAAAQDADATDSISRNDGETAQEHDSRQHDSDAADGIFRNHGEPAQEQHAQHHDAVAADNTARGDCLEGLVLRGGEDCVYPGTDEHFRVEADGTARFLSGTFSGSVDIETSLDGHRYDIVASEQADGLWRLDRVGAKAQGASFLVRDHAKPDRAGANARGTGFLARDRPEPDQARAGAEAPEIVTGGDGSPLGLSDLECRATPASTSGAMAIRIEGVVHARAGVSSVTVSGRIDGGLVDVKSLGRLSSGNSARFVLEGVADASELHCTADLEYFDLSLLRHGQPLRVKWQGSLAR